MIGADGKMKGVAGAKIELELVGKPRGRAKVFPRTAGIQAAAAILFVRRLGPGLGTAK